MFYQIQFNDIQQAISRRIASMQADVIKYANSEKANPKAVEAKTGLVNQLNDYFEYVNSLYFEFKEQQHTDFSAGYTSGYKRCKNEYEPHLKAKGFNSEQKRYDSLTYAMQTQPDLY